MTAPKPLEGVRVLDLSRVLAGPWSGQLLADYGADVIKVERPGSGDDTRAWGPPWWGDPADRMSAYYLSANRGKRSIAIDIAHDEGANLVRQLARDGHSGIAETLQSCLDIRAGVRLPTVRQISAVLDRSRGDIDTNAWIRAIAGPGGNCSGGVFRNVP